MKTLFCAIAFVVVSVATLYAGPLTYPLQSTGPVLHGGDGVPLQVFTPKPSTLKNSTITGTKGYVNHSTATKSAATKWTCTDATGTSKPCKVYPNGQSAYINSPTGEGVRGNHPDVTFWRFGKYSSATSETLIVTSEQQKK